MSHICVKQKIMAEKSNKLKQNINSKNKIGTNWKMALNRLELRTYLRPSISIATLVLWMYLSIKNGLLQNEALLSSAIIFGLLFFQALEQNNQLEQKN